MTVADILAEMAEQAGRSRVQRGALIGNTIENLASLPGQIANEHERRAIFEEQRARQRTKDARETQAYARDEAAARAEERKRLVAHEVMRAYTGGTPNDPTTNNLEAGIARAQELDAPELIDALRKQHAEETKLIPLDTTKDYVNAKGDVVRKGVQPPKSMTPTDLAVLGMNANPVVSAFAKGALNLSRAPKTETPGPIHDTPQGLVRINPDNSTTPLGVQGYHPPPAAGATGGLDDDGLDLLATQYRIQGTSAIPTRISGPDREKLINRAAKQAKALGNSPAQTIQKQYALKSDAAALTKITTMASAAEAFETKAIAQAELVRGLSAKVKRTEYPLVNAALQSGREAVGDTDAHLFANGLLTFTTEYAKLMEGSTGSAAGSSDAARKDAARLIGTALNNGTIDKTLDQMKWEMQQTRRGYDVVTDSITRRMGGPPAAPAAAPAGMMRVIGPNGETGSMPIGNALPPGWRKQ